MMIFLCKPLDKDILIQSLKNILFKTKNKILIIEDDETQAFVLQQILKNLKYQNIDIKHNFNEELF